MTRPRSSRFVAVFAIVVTTILAAASDARAQNRPGDEVTTCDISRVPGAVWWAPASQVTTISLADLASYIAPILWFSPDEPLLDLTEGADIRIPETLPFEEAPPDRPVLYYQLDGIVEVRQAAGTAFTRDEADLGASQLDPRKAAVFKMGFFAYYSSEVGVGAHQHDLEAVELRGGFPTSSSEYLAEYGLDCDQEYLILIITQVTGKAHGINWFFNIVDVDQETRFPMHMFVEEGKHAFGTDKNADGYFTPGYDVTRRVNDAWGTRDVIRSGGLGTGGYQAWMTKVRHPRHKVYPPLPDDSPLRDQLEDRGDYDDPYVEYELRVLPPSELGADDAHLYAFMKSKEVPGWPKVREASDTAEFLEILEEGSIVKSLSVAFRADGDLGLTFVFPLLLIKNFEVDVSGGYIVHRMYIKDQGFRDFGWQLMYTPSASRWFDTYFAAGVEFDAEDVVQLDDNGDPILLPDGSTLREKEVDTDFTLETGVKFRANLGGSALKFLNFLTDFWGLRFGVLNKGFFDISKLTYVFEIGAGVW